VRHGAAARAGLVLLALAGAAGCVQQVPPAVEWGKIIAAVPSSQPTDSTGAGGVFGTVVGAAAGAALGGRGAGMVVGALVGGAVGGTAGAAAEGAVQGTRAMAYTIRLRDGRILTIIQPVREGEAVFAPGQEVAVETRGREQAVSAAAPP
jgi:outer membrane lipoprotein SlyB